MKKILNGIEEGISGVVFMVMLTLAFLNVIFRNFATSISFTEEITTSLFVLLCMMGTSIAARDHGHLGLSVLTELMPRKAQIILAMIANILGAIFSLILLKTGFDMALTEYKMGQISIALQWPQWIYGSFLPIGAFFMTIRFAQAAVQNFKSLKEGDK